MFFRPRGCRCGFFLRIYQDLSGAFLTIYNQGPTSFIGRWTLGYQFTPTVDMQLLSVGFFDRNADGLVHTHHVGIWTTGGALLASATVRPTEPLTGMYVAIPAVELPAGNAYIIGANNYTSDRAIRGDLGVVSVSDPRINIVAGRWRNGNTLLLATNSTRPAFFYDTVNFQFNVILETSAAGAARLCVISWVAGGVRRCGSRQDPRSRKAAAQAQSGQPHG